MIIDTLVVVVCLMVDTPHIRPIKQPANRFTEQFQLSDSLFKEASRRSMKKATEQTKEELNKVLDLSDMRAIIEELKKNSVK